MFMTQKSYFFFDIKNMCFSIRSQTNLRGGGGWLLMVMKMDISVSQRWSWLAGFGGGMVVVGAVGGCGGWLAVVGSCHAQ